MDRTISFAGDPHIGVFSRLFEDVAIIPRESPEEFGDQISDALEVELIKTPIQGCSIIGSLVCGNNNGFVVSGIASGLEVELLEEFRPVMLLDETMNAAGNVILANNSIGLVHPDMPYHLALEIGEFLKVKVIHLTLGGVKTVGMAGVANDKGILVHPRTTDSEIAKLEAITDLPIGRGSVNMGSGLVGTGLIANNKGYLAGHATSGFELGRIEDVLGFI